MLGNHCEWTLGSSSTQSFMTKRLPISKFRSTTFTPTLQQYYMFIFNLFFVHDESLSRLLASDSIACPLLHELCQAQTQLKEPESPPMSVFSSMNLQHFIGRRTVGEWQLRGIHHVNFTIKANTLASSAFHHGLTAEPSQLPLACPKRANRIHSPNLGLASK